METFGCKISPVDLRDYKIDRSYIVATELPETYSSMNIHRIQNQGAIGSCVAHALSTILEHHDDNKCKLSTNFIYGLQNRLYGCTGKGENTRIALNIVKDYGDPKRSLCNGNNEVPDVYEIANEAFDDKEIMEDAYRHKIKSYVRLIGDNDIKYALMNYGPVIAAIKWYKDSKYDLVTGFLNSDKKSMLSYHSIVIYGWDKDGWLCQNSWGANWGNHGLFKLKYSYGVDEAFGIIDDESLGSDYPEIVHPTYGSNTLEIVLKFINKIINLVLGRNNNS